MHTCINIYIYVYIYIYIYKYTYTYVYIHDVFRQNRPNVLRPKRRQNRIYAYVYIYIYICTYVYTYTYNKNIHDVFRQKRPDNSCRLSGGFANSSSFLCKKALFLFSFCKRTLFLRDSFLCGALLVRATRQFMQPSKLGRELWGGYGE